MNAIALAPVNPEAASRAARDPAVDVLARTLYGEARGEPVRGKEAVAAVVMNHVRRAEARCGHFWWGATVEEVCRKPWQFACWNPNDPNREKLLAVNTRDNAFNCCLRIARRAVAGTLKDPTDGATHYHARGVKPPWARLKAPCAVIGEHLFYNSIE